MESLWKSSGSETWRKPRLGRGSPSQRAPAMGPYPRYARTSGEHATKTLQTHETERLERDGRPVKKGAQQCDIATKSLAPRKCRLAAGGLRAGNSWNGMTEHCRTTCVSAAEYGDTRGRIEPQTWWLLETCMAQSHAPGIGQHKNHCRDMSRNKSSTQTHTAAHEHGVDTYRHARKPQRRMEPSTFRLIQFHPAHCPASSPPLEPSRVSGDDGQARACLAKTGTPGASSVIQTVGREKEQGRLTNVVRICFIHGMSCSKPSLLLLLPCFPCFFHDSSITCLALS